MSQPASEFEAFCFRPGFDNEVVAGKISIDRWKLRFDSDTLSDSIPLDHLTVEIEESSERVYLRDSTRPELQLYTLDDSILENQALPQLAEARARQIAVLTRREVSRRLRVLAYVAAACFIVYLLGSLALSLAVKSLAARVPPEWEQAFGKAEIEAMQDEKHLTTHSNEVAQLEALAVPLLQAVHLDTGQMKFFIVDDDVPNAFAMPGGYVVVNTGLLQLLDSQEELLGVLAHELAHVKEKHFARELISSAGPLVVFGVFFRSREGLLNLLSVGSGVMVARGFSQEYETEADDVGWQYLVSANIDPRGMIGALQKLKAYEAEKRTMPGLSKAFDTHPAMAKRIARLERRLKRLPHQDGFLQLTNAIPKVVP